MAMRNVEQLLGKQTIKHRFPFMANINNLKGLCDWELSVWPTGSMINVQDQEKKTKQDKTRQDKTKGQQFDLCIIN
jgi:hypothetical protein